MRSVCTLLTIFLAIQFETAMAADFRHHQWRAAKTFYFVSNHHSFPIFNLNPVFSTDVVNIDNETRAAEGAVCFPSMVKQDENRYRALESTSSKGTIALEAAFGAQGRLVQAVKVDANVDIELEDLATFEVDPLSGDALKFGVFSLRNRVDTDNPDCEVAQRAIEGLPHHIIAANVLHGSIKFAAKFQLKAGSDVSVDLGRTMHLTGPLKVESGSLRLNYDLDARVIVGSGAEKTQAITPAFIGREQVAQIVFFLQGKRGADLKIAVQEAITAKDLGIFTKLAIRASEILDESEFDYDALFVGDPLVAASEIDGESYDKLAVGVAAVELREYVRTIAVAARRAVSTRTTAALLRRDRRAGVAGALRSGVSVKFPE